MLTLIFSAGPNRYALDARKIAEIVPAVSLQPVPRAPEYVAGVFNFREAAVPVVDLCRLLNGTPGRMRLSTRIVLVHYTPKLAGSASRLLGLMAESVTEMRSIDPTQLKAPVVSAPGAPYLGEIAAAQKGFTQMLVIEEILPPELQEMLFSSPERPHEV